MPLSINQIPIPVPSSTDPANFSARGDAVFGAFPDFITETNAVASEAAANRDLAEASKTAAANSETNAATYAANATTSANNASSSSIAPLWVSGTTYAINDKRVSPITGQVYRRKTAGAGTTDPSLDSTNWYAVLLDADTQYPSIKPTLNLDFANSGKLDPRITFTRASTATYYDGKTFAKAEENLLRYSQEFDNAAWAKSAATVGANVTPAPDGSATADKLVPDTSATTHLVSSTTQVVNGATYTFSVYLKAAEYGAALVGFIGGGGFSTTSAAIVDLATGSVSTGVGSLLSMSSTNAGGGYWRISVSLAASASGSGQVYVAAINGSTYADRLNVGNGSSGIYLWGAQLEQRSSVTAYTLTTSQPITKYQPVLKTASNNEPRFDYDPVTLEAKGLLIEEQRTNLLLRSEEFDNASWTKGGSTIGSNAITSPDGTVDADKLTEDTSTNTHLVTQSATVVTSTTYTYSVYLKVAGRGFAQVRYENSGSTQFFAANVNLSSGAITTSSFGSPTGTAASATNAGNGWWRVNLTVTASDTAFKAVIFSQAVSGINSYTGDGFSGIYIWGAQLEAGSFPTSYIPTTTTAVTRQADNAVMTGTNFSSWYNQSEGTMFADYYQNNSVISGGSLLAASDGSNNNRVVLTADGASTGSIQPGLYVTTSSVAQVAIVAGTGSPNSFNKLAAAYAVNNFAASFNGATVVADTDGTIPVVDRAYIGAGATGTSLINGHIKKIAYYPKRLPNYQLQILTK